MSDIRENYILERQVEWKGSLMWVPVETFDMDTGEILRSTFERRVDAERELATYRRDRPQNQYRISLVN